MSPFFYVHLGIHKINIVAFTLDTFISFANPTQRTIRVFLAFSGVRFRCRFPLDAFVFDAFEVFVAIAIVFAFRLKLTFVLDALQPFLALYRQAENKNYFYSILFSVDCVVVSFDFSLKIEWEGGLFHKTYFCFNISFNNNLGRIETSRDNIFKLKTD